MGIYDYFVDTVAPSLGRAFGIIAELGGMSLADFVEVIGPSGTLTFTNLITGETSVALFTPSGFAANFPVIGWLGSLTWDAMLMAIEGVINYFVNTLELGAMPMWTFMLSMGVTGGLVVRIFFHIFF